ncbi:hypothetical protein hrd7_12180 [Leptolinea sp. HRD-7]|nr:hypothetical protein hrd7_12180 [Leptolinea sp. HRD-7]
MPLTTSHPAAVIALKRLNLDLSAMVIGSMTPDFVYFIPGCLPLSDYSHTISGILILGIPLGLAVLAIFQYLIKYPALTLIPSGHQERIYRVTGLYTFFPAKRFLMIAASILIGELTHVFWDSFTHLDGFVVMRVAALRAHLTFPVLTGVPVYLVLQHGSTVVGMLLLIWWYIGWYRRTVPTRVPPELMVASRQKTMILSVMAVLAAMISIISAFTRTNIFQSTLQRLDFFRVGYIVLVASFVVELVLYGIARQWRARRAVDTNSG